MNSTHHRFRQWPYVAAVIAALCSAETSFALSPRQEPTLVPIDWGDPGDYQGPGKPCVTSDGLMLSFMKYTPHRVQTAEWNDVTEAWDNLTDVHDGLGQSWTSASSISPDKQWLFYVGSSGGQGDIYRSVWMGDHWGAGAPLADVNIFGYEDTPYFAVNRLYFAGGANSTDWDIYYSEYDPDTDIFASPVQVVAVNTEGMETTPRIADNGQTLLWSSNRSDGYGGMDIWMTTWDPDAGDWSAESITNLGPIINDSGSQGSPSYSTRDDGLYFMDEGEFVVSVPEPGTLSLVILGGMVLARKRRF